MPPKKSNTLTEAELRLMKILWRRGESAVTDLVAARPIHLAVIDGIRTITGGPFTLHFNDVYRLVHPGLLIAGLNCVCTDAVATALMGFDPMADRGTPPFVG